MRGTEPGSDCFFAFLNPDRTPGQSVLGFEPASGARSVMVRLRPGYAAVELPGQTVLVYGEGSMDGMTLEEARALGIASVLDGRKSGAFDPLVRASARDRIWPFVVAGIVEAGMDPGAFTLEQDARGLYLRCRGGGRVAAVREHQWWAGVTRRQAQRLARLLVAELRHPD